MAEELQEYEDQLREIIDLIESSLQKEVSKLTGPARLEKCEFLKGRLNRGRQLIKSTNVEMRELQPDKRGVWVEKTKVFENQLAKIQQDINWAISSAERDNAGGNRPKQADEMTAKEMMKQQTEQIKGIDENLDQVESNLKRADKQLRAFLRYA